MSMDISFLTIKKEDKDFEIYVKLANKIWTKVFGNEYEENECPGDILVIGYFDDKPVSKVKPKVVCTVTNGDSRASITGCTAIIEISASGKKALISCMGVYPQKRGYGTLLIQYIIKFLKNLGVIKIYLKIDKDDKAKRLEKFYFNNGFTKINEYKEYKECEEDVLFYYDSKFEYVMFCKINSDSDSNLDLDLDLANLKIDS
jgi:N-acetylglutamate synthase-like GNAT family acetyltransferase